MATTFNDNRPLKDSVVDRLRVHAEHDSFDPGGGYARMETAPDWSVSRFRGCALGCTILDWRASDAVVEAHLDLERERQHVLRSANTWAKAAAQLYSLPLWLTQMEETLFETIPKDAAREWPLQLIEAVPVGVPFQEMHEQVRDPIVQKYGKRIIDSYPSSLLSSILLHEFDPAPGEREPMMSDYDKQQRHLEIAHTTIDLLNTVRPDHEQLAIV